MSQLEKKLKTFSEDYDSLRRQSEALIHEKDSELKAMKDSMASKTKQVSVCVSRITMKKVTLTWFIILIVIKLVMNR